MKKPSFLVMAAFLSFGLAHALLPSFGVKGGINYANFVGKDVTVSPKKIHPVGGGFASFKLNSLFSAQTEALYSVKGHKNDLDFTWTYLEIPFLVKASFGSIFVPSVYAGPSYSRLISFTIEGESFDKSVYRANDWGLVVGSELKTPIKISFDLRYTRGLATMDAGTISGTPPLDFKNSVLSLLVGYYFI